MKLCAAAAVLAVAALASPVEGVGDLDEDNEWRAEGWVGGGESNSCAGSFSIVGGGEMNTVRSDFSVIGGGKGNEVVSNYGSILGGYYNKVKGRFGSVVGGTHNQAIGRHSLAMGYYAVAAGDNSAAFGFSGDDCVVSEDSAIKFCVDEFRVNGEDLVAQLEASRRRLAEGGVSDAAATSARVADLRTLVALQEAELAGLSGVRAEQAALLAEVEALEAALATRLGVAGASV